MARAHGRNSRLYIDVAGGGNASPVSFITSWSMDFSTDKVDVTAQGDTNKVNVIGLPDASGSFEGWCDIGAANLFSAALDGTARKFYAYLDAANTPTHYFYGTAFFDFSVSTGVSDAVAVSGSIAPSGTVTQKVS